MLLPPGVAPGSDGGTPWSEILSLHPDWFLEVRSVPFALTGHGSLEMTRRYSHLVREDLRDLVTDEPAARSLPEIG